MTGISKQYVVSVIVFEAMVVFSRKEYVWLQERGWNDWYHSFAVSQWAQFIIPISMLALIPPFRRFRRTVLPVVFLLSGFVAILACGEVWFALHTIAEWNSPLGMSPVGSSQDLAVTG